MSGRSFSRCRTQKHTNNRSPNNPFNKEKGREGKGGGGTEREEEEGASALSSKLITRYAHTTLADPRNCFRGLHTTDYKIVVNNQNLQDMQDVASRPRTTTFESKRGGKYAVKTLSPPYTHRPPETTPKHVCRKTASHSKLARAEITHPTTFNFTSQEEK